MSHITCGDRRVDGVDLQRRIAQAASALESIGVGPGTGVAMCLRNEIEFYEVCVGAGALGAYAVPINWHFAPEEVRYILEDSGATVLVVHADLLPRFAHVVPADVEVRVVPTSDAVRAVYDLAEADVTLPAEAVNWTTWIESFEPRPAKPAEMPLAIFYTSGTTGRPKGVRRPPFTPEQQKSLVGMVTIDYGLGIDDPADLVTGVVGPVYHAAPSAHAVYSFRAGSSMVIMPRFDPEELLRLIEQERITNLNMVPIMFSRLLKLPDEVRGRYDLSSLRFVAHAAAPCPPDVKRAMIEWWGPVINEYYGATEIGNVTFCTAEEWLARPGTVGRAKVGAQIRILDGDENDMPAGQIGEIAASYPGLENFTYHGDEEKRRKADRNGLTAPGDMGYLDEDGYLFISDRKIDMVVSGGVNIYPAEIEMALINMPDVADCAVFGVPDDEFGEALYAVVEPAPGADPSVEDVQAWLRDRIAGYKVPRQIEFRTGLPREDSGKIFKRKLRAPFWEHAGRSI
ncbi:MAG: acyl-CoA synthetase [Solirubrobacterales bacterium]